MPVISILLLGFPSVTLDTKPIQIQRRLPRTLLYYIAHQKHPIGRAEILSVFWPGQSEQDARRLLRVNLSKLRAELPVPGVLITEQDQISLDRQKVFVDSLEFERLSNLNNQSIKIPPTKLLPRSVYQSLVQAIKLWRAPYFMAGVNLPDSNGLEEWLTQTRQTLEHQRNRVLEHLIQHTTATGDLETALQWLRMAVETDEYNEDLHYQILSTLQALGQRTEAIRYASHLRDFFLRELGQDLSPSTQALYEKIRNEPTLTVETNPSRSAWPVSTEFQVPLAGRDEVLNNLQLAYHRGGVVVVSGESGMGKSRIVQELYVALEPAPRLLHVSSHASETNLPYQTLIELLRRSVQVGDWNQLYLPWVNQLSLLLPELVFLRQGVVPPEVVNPQHEQSQLYESVLQLLISISKTRKLLIILENAHFCDEGSLAVFSYLIERKYFNQNRVLVITLSPEEKNSHLDQMLHQPKTVGAVKTIQLEPLHLNEVTTLVNRVTGEKLAADFTQRLYEDTGGNPFFIIETLRSLMDIYGGEISHNLEILPLVSSIQGIVHRRLQGLSPNARQALSTAAIIGFDFQVNILEKICVLDVETLTQALEELGQARLIKSTEAQGPGELSYYFLHHVIHQIVLQEISPVRKRMIHLKIAAALEDSWGALAGPQASLIAQHYQSGGNLERAYHYWLQAGQYNRIFFSLSDIYTAYVHAENILQSQNCNISPAQILQLYTVWGELAYDIKDEEALTRIYQTLLQIGKKAQDNLLIGSAHSGLSLVEMSQENLPAALQHIQQAVNFLCSESTHELAKAYYRYGLIAGLLSQPDKAVALYQEANRAAEGLSHPLALEMHARTNYQLALTQIMTGWPEKALKSAQSSLEQAAMISKINFQVRAYHILSFSSFYLGDYAGAQNYVQAGLVLAEQSQILRIKGYLHTVSAQIALATGNLQECDQHLQKASDLADRFSFSEVKAEVLRITGDVYRMLGCYTQAEEAYQQNIQYCFTDFTRLNNLFRLGLNDYYLGKVAKGKELLQQVIEKGEAIGFGAIFLPAKAAQGIITWQAGNIESAQHEAQELEALATNRKMISTLTQIKLLLAEIAYQERNLETARNYLTSALDLSHTFTNPWAAISLVKPIARIYPEALNGIPPREYLQTHLAHIEANAKMSRFWDDFQLFREKLLSDPL